MKNNCKSLFLYIFLSMLMLGITGCGPKFDDLKAWERIDEAQDGAGGVDKGNVSLDILEGELLKAMPMVIDYQMHKYQYQRANSIDAFAGYGTVSKSVFQYGGALMHTYYYPNSYITGSMGESMKLYPQIYHAYYFGVEHGYPEWKAIAQILYAYSMQELADFFGAVPYNDFRELKEDYPLNYVSTREAYELIFTDLEEAIAILKERKPDTATLQRVEGTQGGYSNLDWTNWVRFANSIRLRMALTMVKVNPGLAETIATDAVNDEIGVLMNADFGLPVDVNATHPLYSISEVWDDYRLGASLENILKRYNNPLIGKWFTKNEAAINNSNGALMLAPQKDYVGMRQGVSVDPSPATNGYGAFSKFKDRTMSRNYFKVTEVLFLCAEGALRGWNMGGTAQEFYEKGIKKVFDENGLSGEFDKYINQTKAKSVPYRDYYKPEFSIEEEWRGVQVGVKWENSDSDETKLEKIITQKYIANYPMSAEAWTSYRRTGYPRLFPVPEKNAWSYDNSVDTELQIRRLPYNETTANDLSNIPNIEIALGTKNQAGVRVWWDVDLGDGRDENNQIVPKNF